MPNYTYNTVHMNGIAKEYLFEEDDKGTKRFDFNKLIRMPESLDITDGSMGDDGLMILYKRAENTKDKEIYERVYLHRNRFSKSISDSPRFDICLNKSDKEIKECTDLACKYVINFMRYGCCTWYEWAINNWGTKWNACDTEIIDEDTIKFDTAWSPPMPVFEALAKKYKDREIVVEWEDEGDWDTVHRRHFNFEED